MNDFKDVIIGLLIKNALARAGVTAEEAGEDLLDDFRWDCIEDIREDLVRRVLGERIRALDVKLLAVRDAHATRMPTSAEEVERVADRARQLLWNGTELQHLVEYILKPGERIEAVEVFSIRTDQRTLSRDEIRNAGRPITFQLGDAAWAERFSSEKELRDLAEELERRKAG